MGWTQTSASLEMVKPVPGIFLAQATPWSPSTPGTVAADVIAVPGFKELSGRRPLDSSPRKVPSLC
jgi:hypothetical protein